MARAVLPSVELSHDKMTEEGHDGTTSGVPTDRQGLKDLLREILTEEPSLLSTDDPAKTNPVGKLRTRSSCSVQVSVVNMVCEAQVVAQYCVYGGVCLRAL